MKSMRGVFRMRTCDKSLSYCPVTYRKILYRGNRGDFGRRLQSRGVRCSNTKCCGCAVRFSVVGSEEGLRVTKWCMSHDHEMNSSVMQVHPAFRKLTGMKRKEVEPFSMENYRVEKIKSFVLKYWESTLP
ncbi:unnamed protein product [Calicophoron daubneyi]|uniref:FAR1 domain-containing protein n=1 Tax=Calicophoron daubneyi TaxID=300641 RepID=A0AAV2T0H5_CALDB